MNEFLISVVVCTYNRSASLRRMLSSLEKQQPLEAESWELIVVDNNSKDDTSAVVDEVASRLTIPTTYLFEGKQGKSYALNTGIAAARGRILAFTDDDVMLDPGWLRGIADGFTQLNCVGMGGRVIPLWEQEKPFWLQEYGPYKLMDAIVKYDLGDDSKPAPFPPVGANMAFHRDAFAKYGVFRTDLGPSGLVVMRNEDTEFCQRLMDAGETIMYFPDAIVFHPVEPHRMRKGFFMSFYYQHGKAEMRLKKDLGQNIFWFGVPRYLFRQQVEYLLKWLLSFGPEKRFYYKLQSIRIAGAISETFRSSVTPS